MKLKPEITSDGTTVWVNTDINLGRFGKHAVDVHHDAAGQAAGKHCLNCFRRTPGNLVEDWNRFKASMLEHHGVNVSDHHRPVQ